MLFDARPEGGGTGAAAAGPVRGGLPFRGLRAAGPPPVRGEALPLLGAGCGGGTQPGFFGRKGEPLFLWGRDWGGEWVGG